MSLHDVNRGIKKHKKGRRIGRGIGSGRGKTSGLCQRKKSFRRRGSKCSPGRRLRLNSSEGLNRRGPTTPNLLIRTATPVKVR